MPVICMPYVVGFLQGNKISMHGLIPMHTHDLEKGVQKGLKKLKLGWERQCESIT